MTTVLARASAVNGRCWLAVALALLVTPASARAEGFLGRIPAPLASLGDALAASIGRSLPVPAASAGFSYVFDPRTNVFERETSLAAQLFLERAEPIGAGRLHLAVLYQHVDLDTFDGRSLDETGFGRWTFRGFRFGGVRLRLTVDEVVPTVTWGVTDDLEVGATLPIVTSDFALRSGALSVQNGPTLLGGRRVDDSATGPGDLLLRAKWALGRSSLGRVALGLGLRLPTGSEDDFQGTGGTEVLPMAYWSSGPLLATGPVGLEVHANAGMLLAADDVDQSEGRWGVAADVALGSRVALALGVLGRHAVSGLAPGPTCGNLPQSLNAVCAARQAGLGRPPVSAVGLATSRPDFFDLTAGVRVRLWRDTLLAVAHVLVPLNDDGFRSDVVPIVGIEAAF